MDASLYRHIIFMNSSVRGPFLPNYFPVSHFPLLSEAGNKHMYIRHDLRSVSWCMWPEHCMSKAAESMFLGREFSDVSMRVYVCV